MRFDWNVLRKIAFLTLPEYDSPGKVQHKQIIHRQNRNPLKTNSHAVEMAWVLTVGVSSPESLLNSWTPCSGRRIQPLLPATTAWKGRSTDQRRGGKAVLRVSDG